MYDYWFFGKATLVGAASAALFAAGTAQAGSLPASVQLEATDSGNPIGQIGGGGSDSTIAGGFWVDPGGDVQRGHDFNDTEEDGGNGNDESDNDDVRGTVLDPTPTGNTNVPDFEGHYAGLVRFEVSGSDGDDLDPVANNPNKTFEFKASFDEKVWQGASEAEESNNDNDSQTEVSLANGDVEFSHEGSLNDITGQWIDNNNQQVTPGVELEDVRSYIEFDSDPTSGQLTGTKGTFAFLAKDAQSSDDGTGQLGLFDGAALGFGTDDEFVSENYPDWATNVSTATTGEMTVAPSPSAIGGGVMLLGVLGGGALMRRRRKAV